MTVIIRTQSRLGLDFVCLSTIVFLQAAILVWLGDELSAGVAAVVLIASIAVCAAIPAAAIGAFTRVRSLGRNVRWWHWLWACLFFSDFVFRMRDVQSIQDDPLDAWAIYRVALVGLAGLVLMFRLATRRGEW